MRSPAIMAFFLLLSLPARAEEGPCAEIAARFAAVDRLEIFRCEDAVSTRHRFSLQMPELLRGCRELAAFNTTQGAQQFRELSRRFRNRVIYELLTSPADDKEFDESSASAHLCHAEIEPLMRFRQKALSILLNFDEKMAAKFQEP